MIFLHSSDVKKVDPYIDEGKCVFILIYMNKCGPCMATHPEWLKIESELEDKYKNNDSIIVADIEKDHLSSLKYIGDVDGFPTMKYICKKNGNLKVESYDKNRTVDSFVEWIESKIRGSSEQNGGSSPYHVLKRLSRKSKKGKKSRKRSKKSRKSRKSKKRSKK